MIAVMLAGGIAMVLSLLATPFLIKWLQGRQLVPVIKDELREVGDHATKHAVPRMGGVMIIAASVIGYLVAHIRAGAYFSRGGLLVMGALIGGGIVGFVDDWLTVTGRNMRGLSERQKAMGQFVVAALFAILAIRYAAVHTRLAFTRLDLPGWDLGPWLWVALAVFIIIAMSNGVNFADGLDGLAGGSATFAFSAFVIIGFWQFRHVETYAVPQALDLALAASAMAGACVGFLWWAAYPAQIQMGDTGSNAIGAGLGALAMLMNLHLLLPFIGALYLVETLSVIIQRRVFVLSGRRYRVFRMAPIHHHFEMLGWPETTILIRFWIMAGLATALALGIFYADFINLGLPE